MAYTTHSGQNSFSSKGEESSLNNGSHYEQSHCSDTFTNSNESNLTKKKRGRKQTNKDQIKLK